MREAVRKVDRTMVRKIRLANQRLRDDNFVKLFFLQFLEMLQEEQRRIFKSDSRSVDDEL